MESVTRFWSHEAQNIRCVREADFDRVSAENLALQEELKQQKRYVEINANSAHGKHMEGLRYRDERDALQLLLNERDEQVHSLEQRRHAEQQACQAAERRVEELKSLLPGAELALNALNVAVSVYDVELADKARRELRKLIAALNPTAEAVSHE